MSSNNFAFRERIELQLAEHIKKAINPIETAPKQKHIRWCILFAWERQTCHEIWNSLKMQPAISNEIGAFKSLIMIHKILMGGPPVVLCESYLEKSFFDTCTRYFGNTSPYGYGNLIRAYVAFLRGKLDYHHTFKEFTGNFDFEAYSAAKSSKDVNEGYQILCELMDLQDKLTTFYSAIFNTFGGSLVNECKISSLVPVVEESYGIYNFITSYLLNLFNTCEYVEPLYPLQERYTKQFYSLKRFYEDCSKIQYLTSLITIPQLPDSPPVLFQNPNLPVGSKKSLQLPMPQPSVQFPSEQDSKLGFNLLDLPSSSSSLALNAPNQRQENLIEEYMKEIQNLKMQIQKDQLIIGQYSKKFMEMEQNVQMLNQKLAAASENNQDSLMVKSLQDQINSWKAKYEAILEMYNNLKKDHFELLEKFQKSLASPEQLNRLKEEINRLNTEKRQSNIELEKTRENSQLEIAKLRKEIIDLKSGISTNESAKEREYISKIEKLLFENSQLKDKLADCDPEELKAKLAEISRLGKEKSELNLKIQELQSLIDDNEKSLVSSFDEQFSNRESVFREILIESFVLRIQQTIDDFSNPSISGNLNSNAHIIFSYLELVQSIMSENTYDCNSTDFQQTINFLHEICSYFNTIILSMKGILTENLIDEFKSCLPEIQSGISTYFREGTFGNLSDSLSVCLDMIHKLDNENISSEIAIANMSKFVAEETNNTASIISDALERLKSLKCDISIQFTTSQSAILDCTLALTDAISHLIKCATIVQNEIVSQGKGSGSAEAFYKKHHRWTEGLISAAKTVAYGTKFLVETAEKVIIGDGNMDELIVASRDVTASTAQLVAAARVKAARDSKAQWNLEEAAGTVNETTKALISSVELVSQSKSSDTLTQEFSEFSVQQLKVTEMNQQIKILSLERTLQDARKELALMRKASYHKEIN